MKPLDLFIMFVFVCSVLLQPATTSAKPASPNPDYQDIIKQVKTDRPWIALTFDDGPDPEETPAILDILKKYHARATFFVIGEQGQAYPELLKREVAEGHELANHSFSHPNFRRLSGKEISQEIIRSDEQIYAITGRHPTLFRPPGGYHNPLIVKTAKQSGHVVILWSWYQDSMDWSKPGAAKIAQKVTSNAHPGDIVLLHDRISGKSQTAEALQAILPQLKKQGYRFVTVSQLLGSVKKDAQASAGTQDRAYHYGFVKSRNGMPPSLEEEGFRDVLQKHDAIVMGDPSQKELYLTFNNGYENGNSAKVLDILKQKQVPAAFFITGYYAKYQPELLKRMAAEGHIIGNHSWGHPDMTKLSDQGIRDELNKLKQETANITGKPDMPFMRPPSGTFSERVLRVGRELGYTNVFWSVAYVDWDPNHQKGWRYAYTKVMEQLHPGAVIMLHTVSNDNVQALAKIIDTARSQGYVFKSLDQLTSRHYGRTEAN